MLIFVYEHLTGGGLLTRWQRPGEAASLAVEGRAMLAALAADLAAIDGVEVAGLRYRRLQPIAAVRHCHEVDAPEQRDAAFDELAAKADWSVVIAPEIGGALAERCQRVLHVAGRLLGGSLETVLLAGDKHATATHLAAAGVPVPRGIRHRLGEPWPQDFAYPAVWKPLDGAGSAGLQLVENYDAPVPESDRQPGRLEELCPKRTSTSPFALRKHVLSRSERRPSASKTCIKEPGIAASVAFLCGPAERLGLPPCRQQLGENFRYLGGSLPLEPPLAERAACLARRAIETLPDPLGYVGVDLMLSTEDADNDVVIEINPRLTTSYLGLRACHENLAAAMLAVAQGRPLSLSFHETPIEWQSDGCV